MGRPPRPPGQPTARNIEVLQAVVVHGTFARAAEALFVSIHTVDWHIDVLRKISGFHTLPQIMTWAFVMGYLGSDVAPGRSPRPPAGGASAPA